jgi:hypothetical protein
MKRVEHYKDLKDVDSIAWAVKENADGDSLFSPERSAVRFTDSVGNYWELTIGFSCWDLKDFERNYWSIAKTLDEIFHSLGLLQNKTVGEDLGISEAINECRKALPVGESYLEREYSQDVYIF